VNQQKGRGLREGLFGWLSPSLIHEINHVEYVTGFWRALSRNSRPYTIFAAEKFDFHH